MLTVARELARLAAAETLRVGSRALSWMADAIDPSEESIGVPVFDEDPLGFDPLAGGRTMIAPPPRSDTMPSPSMDEPLAGSLEARGLAGAKRHIPWR